MTASARRADLADRTPCLSRPSRRIVRPVRAAPVHRRWAAIVVWLVCGGLSAAQEPLVVGDGVPPLPEIVGVLDGGFDDGAEGVRSVLVDDGGAESADLGNAIGAGAYHAPVADEEPWCDPCEPGWDGAGGSCPAGRRWAIQADALVLWRNNIGGQPLLLDSFGGFALDPDDVRTAAAAGPRIGVVRSLGCGRSIEGNWFNVGGIQGTTVTDGLGVPYTAIGIPDLAFGNIDAAQFTTRGQIKSAELNYRWSQGRRVIWLAGFRWVEWNETAAVNFDYSVPAPEFPVTGSGFVQSQVGNDLYGGQFGCRIRLWNLGKWQVSTVGKAGVFGNVAFQNTSAALDGAPLSPLGAALDDVAFFGEVGVNSTLWITRWLAWRAGYNFFWLEGVATAAQQFPLANFNAGTTTINTNGSVFLQGFSTGLEARW